MSYPNLSITGKPSPRTIHPASAGKRRTPLTDYRDRNQSSSIFGSDENVEDNKKQNPRTRESKNQSVGIVSKSKLQEIHDLTNRDIGIKNARVAEYGSPRKAAPDGVPKLSLDEVIEKDDDMSYKKIASGVPKIHTPDSKDTFSWGTPLRQNSPKTVKGGGWQVNQGRSPGRVSSSTRQKHKDVPDLDLKLSQSNNALGQLRKAAKDVREDLNINYLGASKLIQQDPNKCNRKKQDFIEQAILQDQASRMKLNDERPSSTTSQVQFGLSRPFDARSKRHEELFNSRSVVAGVQDDLSKRFSFSARILSSNGHDAQRQLNGFFFVNDNTLTMYEFRQFGTRANALPFIQRGLYTHPTCHRKDKPICILDIKTGQNLTFLTASQPSLPDRLKGKQTLTFRITSTDDDKTRMKLLYDGCKTSKQKQEVDLFIQKYEKENVNPGQETLKKIQDYLRNSLQSRGAKTMTTLLHHFQNIDKSGDGFLNKVEIKNALQKFRINIPDHEFDIAWEVVDANKDGFLDYGEFVRGFFGQMNEYRKTWVRKAFSRLDTNNNGLGDADSLYKFFCPSKHPSVKCGEMSEQELLESIQDVFQISKRRKEIPYQIFEAYYEGVSGHIATDEEFINLIKTTWTI